MPPTTARLPRCCLRISLAAVGGPTRRCAATVPRTQSTSPRRNTGSGYGVFAPVRRFRRDQRRGELWHQAAIRASDLSLTVRPLVLAARARLPTHVALAGVPGDAANRWRQLRELT